MTAQVKLDSFLTYVTLRTFSSAGSSLKSTQSAVVGTTADARGEREGTDGPTAVHLEIVGLGSQARRVTRDALSPVRFKVINFFSLFSKLE